MFVPGMPGACLGRFPSTYHLGVLYGASYRVGIARVRALVGPALFFGDGSPGIGTQAHVDLAAGAEHVELVLGYRASVVRRATPEMQVLGAAMLGVRLQ